MKSITIDGVNYVPEMSREPDVSGLKYAIVRSRNDGVKSGYVVSIDGPTGQCVTLLRARQLWKWSSRFVLLDLAEFGPTEKHGCKFSAESRSETVMLEACGVLYCSPLAERTIRNISAQEPGK